MKRTIGVMMAIMLMPMLASMGGSHTIVSSLWTDPDTGISWYYRVFNGEAHLGGVTKNSGCFAAIPTSTAGDIVVPPIVDGYPVTEVIEEAFDRCYNLTSVTFSEGIRIIDADFYGCTELRSVTIPSTVTHLSTTFGYGYNGEDPEDYYCENLTNITVHSENITYSSKDGILFSKDMDDLIFCPRGWDGEYQIPYGVKNICAYAFAHKSFYYNECASLSIPSSVTNIGAHAFEYCYGIGSVSIPKSVLIVDEYAFNSCLSITNVEISCRKIGDCAFKYCWNIEAVSLLNGVEEIGKEIFYLSAWAAANIGLPSLTIPSSVRCVGDGAFASCSIASLTILPGIKTIGASAFSKGTYTSVTIPESVDFIGAGAFASSCAEINVDVGNKSYCSAEGVLFSKDMSHLIFYPRARNGVYAVPSDVRTIDNSAFASCGGLSAVTLPQGVESIGESAFAYCTGLLEITIPHNVRVIPQSAFAYCDNLSVVTLLHGLESIEAKAFHYCKNLQGIDIPYGVTNISWAFQHCTSLKSVKIPKGVMSLCGGTFDDSEIESITFPVTLETIGEDFEDASVQTLYCEGAPPGLVGEEARIPGAKKYYNVEYAAEWSSRTAIPYEPENNTKWTFVANNGGTIVEDADLRAGSISIPAYGLEYPVTKVGDFAFYGSRKLCSAVVAENVKTIGRYSFCKCTSLTNVIIGVNVTNIEDHAFYGCSEIGTLHIPEVVKYLGKDVFAECSELSVVYFDGLPPAGLSTIGINKDVNIRYNTM